MRPGASTNFDAVYARIIAPAVEQAGLEPIRADEEKIGGTIHKPMFERLMLCHYAVADITGANPNVFYELGIRHAMRPRSTVIVFARRHRAALRHRSGARHRLQDRRRRRAGRTQKRRSRQIADQLEAARGNPHDDSPIFQLVEERAALGDRSHQDRHLPQQRRLFEALQGPLASAREGGRDRGARRSPPSPRFPTCSRSKPASWSTCFFRCAT